MINANAREQKLHEQGDAAGLMINQFDSELVAFVVASFAFVMSNPLERYQVDRSYAWNYKHAPDWRSDRMDSIEPTQVDGQWRFCGLPVDSMLGISAGPLLNGAWCLYYAKLGFDVVTYKTVRSSQRDCYPQPNLVPVDCGQIDGGQQKVSAAGDLRKSWAVSYGMPSADPDVWRHDVEQTRQQLPAGKLLSVSAVGTMQADWSIDDLAADYAKCAKWAIESGADVVETNFSCPNVSTCDGQLYQNTESSVVVASAVRDAIGSKPLILKIGHTRDREAARLWLQSVGQYIDAIAMTNSIAAVVCDGEGEKKFFDGHPRGICGDAIRNASIAQVRMFSELCQELGLSIQLIGVGGISQAQHVKDYLAAGAGACHLATAVMLEPNVGLTIREDLASVR